MSGEDATVSQDSGSQDDGRGRQRSTIAFPYIGLKEAVDVGKAIHDHVGSGECDDDQLAAWLDSSPRSSGYRVRLSAARMFGVIKTVSTGTHTLSELGMEIVDPQKTREARVKAFLNVPLFGAFFDRWKGRQLPPPAALERELVGLGVAEKQRDRARQVLERSAQQAGFCEQGKDRLVRPGVAQSPPPPKPEHDRGGNGGGGDDEPPLDPVIRGLINKLPPPGAVWPEPERELWLELIKGCFRLIYKESPKAINQADYKGESDEGL